MPPMPLTPILRRTFAIFRDRPLLFTLFPLLLLLAFAFLPQSPDAYGYSTIATTAASIGVLLLVCVGEPLSYAVIVALTLEAEEGSSISFAHAWQRVCRRPGVVRTTLMIEFLFAGFIFVLALAALVIGGVLGTLPIPALHPSSPWYPVWSWIGSAVALSVFARAMIPSALAIPLVLMGHSEKAVPALDESWRLARGIFWSLAAIVALPVLQSYILPYLGGLVHFPASMTTAAGWTGKIFLQIVDAVCSVLSYIAITLIAVDRNAASQQQETLPAITTEPHSSAQVVIL